MEQQKYLTLDLDDLYGDSYYYTEYDISAHGHSITIYAEDKEEFLDRFATIWRERASKLLYEDENFKDEWVDHE